MAEQCRADRFDLAGIGARAATAGNPVIPLVADLRTAVPDHAARAVHVGATSQDVIDTSLMLLARRTIPTIDAALAARRRGRGRAGRAAPGRRPTRPHPAAARGADHVRADRGDVAGRPGRGQGRARPRGERAAGRAARRRGGDVGAPRRPRRRGHGAPGRPAGAGRTRAAVGHEPGAGRRAGRRAGPGRRRGRQGGHRRHRPHADRGRRGARAGRTRPRRVVGHAPQAQPGLGHARRVGRPPGGRRGHRGARRPAPGPPAGRRPLARGVGPVAARPPPDRRRRGRAWPTCSRGSTSTPPACAPTSTAPAAWS